MSGAREAMHKGRGGRLRSGMQESWQARQRVGVSEMQGNVEKTETENGREPPGRDVRQTALSMGPRSWQK